MRQTASPKSKLRRILSPLAFLARLFVPASRIRFTREGFWFFFLTLAVGVAALNTGIGLLFLMLAMMLSFIIVSGILSELSLMMLQVKRVIPNEVYARAWFPVTIKVQNHKRFFPSLCLDVSDPCDAWSGGTRPKGYILKIPAGETSTIRCRGMIPHRGLHSVGRVTMRTAYPFGLFIKEAVYRCEEEVLAYPAMGVIHDQLLREALDGVGHRYRRDLTAQEQDEFHAVRDYRPGDNPRWIHWRTSARMDRLMIKEFDALEGNKALVYLDTAAPTGGDDSRHEAVENAVSFTATLINEFHDKGYLVTLVVADPEPLVLNSRPGRGGLVHLLKALALVGLTDGGLEALMGNEQVWASSAGIRVLVTAGRGRRSIPREWSRGLKIVGASDPSFSSLFTPPEGEGAHHEF